MNSKQKKPVVKIAVALISVFGFTAIGISSAFAIANKQRADVDETVRCKAYEDAEHRYYKGYKELSAYQCNYRQENSPYDDYYWLNAGS